MVLADFFRTIGRLVLSRDKSREMDEFMRSAGKEIDSETFVGQYIVGSFILALIVAPALTWIPGLFPTVHGFISSLAPVETVVSFIVLLVIIEIITFVSIGIITYVGFILSIENRTNAVETVLPDFLMFVSANVKAGMPLDQAIWYAAKPEFGLLSIEVRRNMKQAFSGEPLEESLDQLASAFRSDIFNRTIILLKQAIATGAEVAEVLERTSQNARDSLLLRKEIQASLVLYEIFVLFASIVGTPFLFGVSTRLITILEKVFTQLPTTAAVQGFNSLVQPSTTPIVASGDFYIFTLAVLLTTSLFSSLIIGSIKTGSKNQGIKYFPFILVLSVIIYHVVIILLENFFSSILL